MYGNLTAGMPQANFLSLSRELRDQIYEESLISSSPIIVWSEELLPHPRTKIQKQSTEFSRFGSRRNVERAYTNLSLKHIAWNTIRSNKMISLEVAPILYGKNTFRFIDEHNWDPIMEWLVVIGVENQNSLLNLEMETFRPDRVWQTADGQRVRCNFTNEAIVYPRNPFLELPVNIKVGFVDNINPVIEDIISLLMSRETNHTTTLSLFVPAELFPGVNFVGCGGDHNGFTFTMDLPNLIQKFCQQYIESPDYHALLQVFWKGEVFEPAYEIEERRVEPAGWEVLTLSLVQLTLPMHGEDQILPFLRYVLERKEITGTLLAADPLGGDFMDTVEKLNARIHLRI